MSQQLQPSNAPIRVEQLPPEWITVVRSAIRHDKQPVRECGLYQIEVYSFRTEAWHVLSPIFVDQLNRDLVLAQLLRAD